MKRSSRPIAKPIGPINSKEQRKRTNLSLFIVLFTSVFLGLKLFILSRGKLDNLESLRTIRVGDETLAIVAYVNETSALLSNWAFHVQSHGLPCNIAFCGAGEWAGESHGCLIVPVPACAPNYRVRRWIHVSQLLKQGIGVLHMDTDTVMVRNPLEYFAKLFQAHPHASVFTASDANTGVYTHDGPGNSKGGVTVGEHFHAIVERSKHVPPPTTRWLKAGYPPGEDGLVKREELDWRTSFGQDALLKTLAAGYHDLGLEAPENCFPAEYVMGLQVWLPGPRTDALMEAFILALDMKKKDAVDQWPFNAVTKSASQFCAFTNKDKIDALACGGDKLLNSVAGGMACVGLLSVVQFANGVTYSMTREHEQYGVQPFIVQASHTRRKVMRLKEEGFYFRSELNDGEKLLMYQNNPIIPLPPYTWQKHYGLMQEQLQLLRKALALALLLNRTLVLPQMITTCENFYFAGVDCVLLGHRFRIPTIQPLDHWLVKLPSQHVREPGFAGPHPTAVTLEKAVNHDAINLMVTNLRESIELAPAGSLGLLGAWCCFLNDTVLYKVLYDAEAPPEIVLHSQYPNRMPGF